MSELVLGIDGGGSRSRAAIADGAGRVLATAEAGPSNFDDVGVPAATANIGRAVAAARKALGFDGPFAAAFLGLAGVVSERDRALARSIAEELELAPGGRVQIDHDCRVALAGALSGRPGIVLIVGTGSSCYGRTASGEDWRAGGWGSLVSDEGSAWWLGRAALEAVVRALDGRGTDTLLRARLLAELGVEAPEDLMHRIYVPPMARSEIAALAPIVTQAAREGDAVAERLIAQSAEELSLCVRAVVDALDFELPVELAPVGGLAEAEPRLVHALANRLERHAVPCRVVRAEAPPVVGACLLARDLLAQNPARRISTP